MQRLLIMSVVTILAVASVYGGQPTRPSESNIVFLLRQAAGLKGDDYVQARDRILQSAKTQAARGQLAEIAKDPKTSVKTRLLADLCLLRLNDDSAADAFYSDLGEVVASVFADKRIWEFTTPLPARDYLRQGRPRAFLSLRPKRLGEENDSVITPEHANAVRRLLRCDGAWFAECLMWHTDATLRDTLMSGRSEQLAKQADKDKSTWQAPGRDDIGWVAKFCASWFLVVNANTRSVGILELWGKSGNGPSRIAMRYLNLIEWDKQVEMSVRREAILAYARVGGKATLEYLERVKAKNREEGIRNAAEEAIRQIKGKTTAPASITESAEIPTTKPTGNR